MTLAQINDLARHLGDLIRVQGPIPVSVFMAEALGHPDFGYYKTRETIGRDGDFVTAPEVSQMFGELIGVWCADMWQRMGAPLKFCLVELGPGKGTLMADLMRALAAIPGAVEAAQIHLVETSPRLAAQQRQKLDAVGISGAHWHQRLEDVPNGASIVIANEFFDALPIRQFFRSGEGWRERLVDLDPDRNGFRFTLATRPTPDPEILPAELRSVPVDSIVEVCPTAQALVSDLAERISQDDGAALIIDYGPAQSGPGDSLQAVSDHDSHAVLDRPGEIDLTAHVDFYTLARVAKETGIAAHGPVTQGSFLEALGIDLRAAALAEHATPAQQQDLRTATDRLVSPDQMGELFKVMALTRADQHPPAGFGALA